VKWPITEFKNVSPFSSNSESFHMQLNSICQVQHIYFSSVCADHFLYILTTCFLNANTSQAITTHIDVCDAVSKPCYWLMDCTYILVDVVSGPSAFVFISLLLCVLSTLFGCLICVYILCHRTYSIICLWKAVTEIKCKWFTGLHYLYYHMHCIIIYMLLVFSFVNLRWNNWHYVIAVMSNVCRHLMCMYVISDLMIMSYDLDTVTLL